LIACAAVMIGLAALPPLAFKGPGGWVLSDEEGKSVRRVGRIGSLWPEEVCVSQTTEQLVFTAKQGNAPWAGLYRSADLETWEPLSPHGYHAEIHCSATEAAVFLIHQTDPGAGPKGAHETMSYGQVWRFDLKTGTRKKLTGSPGCKGNPSHGPRNEVVFDHNTCRGQQILSSIDKQGAEVPLSDVSRFLSEPRISPDGRMIAFTKRGIETTELVLARRDRSAENVLATTSGIHASVSLQWANNSRFVFWVSGGLVKKLNIATGATTELFSLPLESK
jgi:hypothetical protein